MTGSILLRDALLKRCGVSLLRVNEARLTN